MAGELVLFPMADYSNGTRTIGPRNVPGGVNSLTFAIARSTTADPTIWPNQSTTVAVNLEASFDGGVTWQTVVGGTAEGGIAPGRHGGEATESSWVAGFPGTDPSQARLTVTVAGGPIHSEGTLRWA